MYEGNDYRNYLMHRDHKYLDRIKTSYGWRYIYDKITNKGDGNSNGNDSQYNFSSQRNNMSRNGFQRTGDAIRRNVQAAYAKFKNIGADKKHQNELDNVYVHTDKVNNSKNLGNLAKINSNYTFKNNKEKQEYVDKAFKEYYDNKENPGAREMRTKNMKELGLKADSSNMKVGSSVDTYNNIRNADNLTKQAYDLTGYTNKKEKGATDYSNYKSPTDIKKAREEAKRVRAEEKKALAEREARINQNATNRANKKKQDAQRRNAQNQIQEMANRTNSLADNARAQREAINAERAEAARKKQELKSNAKRAELNSAQAKNTEMSYRYGGRGASEKAIREHQRNSEAAARQETAAKAARQKNVGDYERYVHDMELDRQYKNGIITNAQYRNIQERKAQGIDSPKQRQSDLIGTKVAAGNNSMDQIHNWRLQDKANGYSLNNRNMWDTYGSGASDSVQRYNQTRRKRR